MAGATHPPDGQPSLSPMAWMTPKLSSPKLQVNRDFGVFRCHYIGPSVWHSLQEQQYVVNDQLGPSR